MLSSMSPELYGKAIRPIAAGVGVTGGSAALVCRFFLGVEAEASASLPASASLLASTSLMASISRAEAFLFLPTLDFSVCARDMAGVTALSRFERLVDIAHGLRRKMEGNGFIRCGRSLESKMVAVSRLDTTSPSLRDGDALRAARKWEARWLLHP